jgi:hypothetical protein
MLKAWCLDPRNLHRDMTLIISEPGPAAGEKRCLSYKISLLVTPVDASEKAIVIPTPLSDSDPPDVTVIPPSLGRHRDVQGTVLVGGAQSILVWARNCLLDVWKEVSGKLENHP